MGYGLSPHICGRIQSRQYSLNVQILEHPSPALLIINSFWFQGDLKVVDSRLTLRILKDIGGAWIGWIPSQISSRYKRKEIIHYLVFHLGQELDHFFRMYTGSTVCKGLKWYTWAAFFLSRVKSVMSVVCTSFSWI